MKKIATIVVLCVTIALLCTTIQCKKDESWLLPSETQIGRGIFGCLVNGMAIRQNYSITSGMWPGGAYDIAKGLFVLNARTELIEYRLSFFVTRPRFGAGTFVIDSVIFYPIDPSIPYYYTAINTALITFTKFDESTSPAIASGTFEFDANGHDKETHQHIPNQKIRVRKGRFDVRYYPS